MTCTLTFLFVARSFQSTELLQEGNLKEAYGESVKSLSWAGMFVLLHACTFLIWVCNVLTSPCGKVVDTLS